MLYRIQIVCIYAGRGCEMTLMHIEAALLLVPMKKICAGARVLPVVESLRSDIS